MKLIDESILKIVPKSELNGLGSKGLGWLVRDRWGGVDFSKAGNIHDATYYIIGWYNYPDADKRIIKANKVFYQNLCIINEAKSKTRIGRYLRKPILFLYYMGVKIFGRFFV